MLAAVIPATESSTSSSSTFWASTWAPASGSPSRNSWTRASVDSLEGPSSGITWKTATVLSSSTETGTAEATSPRSDRP